MTATVFRCCTRSPRINSPREKSGAAVTDADADADGRAGQDGHPTVTDLTGSRTLTLIDNPGVLT